MDCCLEEGDCKDVGSLGRIMIARLNRQVDASEPPRPDRPKLNYNSARREEDPFLDRSLLDPFDSEQHEKIKSTADKKVELAKKGLKADHHKKP